MPNTQSASPQPDFASQLFGGGPSQPSSAQPDFASQLFGGQTTTPAAPDFANELFSGPAQAPSSKQPDFAHDLFSGNPASKTVSPELNNPSADYTTSPDEPWYSRTWAYLNKPLYDAHQWGFKSGFGQGVEDIVTGLTSPLSLALSIGGLGSGTLLDALGVGASELPVALKGIQTALDAGFTLQGVHGVLQQVPQALDALKFGDYTTAERLMTDALAGGTFATLGGMDAVHRWGEFSDGMGWTKPAEQLTEIRKLWGGRREAVAEHLADLRQQRIDLYKRFEDARKEAGIDDSELALGAMRRWMAFGGDADQITKHRNALAGAAVTAEPAERAASETAPEPRIEVHPQESAFTAMLRQNAEKMKAQSTAELIENAVKHFGVTDDATKTGYVLPDGRGLDFSGKNQARTLSHEAINQIGGLKEADRTARAGFMSDTGSMRTHVADGQIAVELPSGKEPTEAQLEWIRRTVAENPNSTFTVDVTDPQGRVLGTDEAAEAEVRDAMKALGSARQKALQKTPAGTSAPKLETPVAAKNPSVSNAGFQKAYSPQEKQALLDSYDLAARLPKPLADLAGELRQMFDTDGRRAYENGMLRHFVENYVTNIWKPQETDQDGFWQRLFRKPSEQTVEENPAANKLLHQSNSGAFDTSFDRARRRVFQSEFEGQMLGRKLAVDDPIALALNYRWQLEKTLADREFLAKLMDGGTQTSDGSPITAIAGNGKIVGEESKNPALLIFPNQMRSPVISDSVLQGLSESGRLQDLLDKDRIVELGTRTLKDGTQKPIYGWNTGDYVRIDHPAFRDWNWIHTANDGTNVQMQGDLRVHPEAADFIRQAVGADTSAIRETALGRAALRGGSEAKHLLLSLSPFHIVQEGLRGIMAGINPFFSKLDPNFQDEPLLRIGTRNGLQLYRDFNALEDYTEGVGGRSEILNKVPGLRQVQNGLQDFLFDRYIPALKARAFKSYFERYRRLMPAALDDEVAHAAATRTNEMFGGLDYLDLGRSATSQDIFRLAALAPDWLESEIRLLGSSLGFRGGTEAKISAIDNARIIGALYLTTRVLNLLSTGKTHPEAPLGVVIPGGPGQDDKVWSVRTLPTDLIHALSDPRNFLMGRVNPLTVRSVIEAGTGRDQYGRKVTLPTEIGDFFQNIAPIPSQTAMRQAFHQVTDLSNPDQVAKAAGLTVYRYRTEAEKMASELASNNTPDGPIPPDQRERHLRDIRLTDALRSGAIQEWQLYHQLPRYEADAIVRNATLTPLQARFEQLPLRDALSVWGIAQDAEKDQLHTILWRKRYNWLKVHFHNGHVDDPDDPTWIRLKQVYPDLSRFGSAAKSTATPSLSPIAWFGQQESSPAQQGYPVIHGDQGDTIPVEAQNFERNKQWAKPGPYVTPLTSAQEAEFQRWVKDNGIPFNPNDPHPDYDMRGFWKAMITGNPQAKRAANLHFPDKWKTPYDATFSNQSMYARSDAPHWVGNKLYTSDGVLLDDESGQ